MSIVRYHKADLIYLDYSWTPIPGDDPKVTGPLDSAMFSRHEGFEVLYLINKFMEVHDLKGKNVFNKIERMIHDQLPSNLRSQKHVKEWLAQQLGL